MNTTAEALDWIQSLKPFGYKPGNERMLWMLNRTGNPERRLKFVHIAGTNGKGSNVAFLSSVLRTCGYEVGTYISPHITTYLSRVSFNGEEITEVALVELSQLLRPLVEELAQTELGSPTEFEVMTMIAILYFARYTYPDIVIWETGLGGRFDSTNVVHPLVTIITNVGLDHTKILGDTLEKIAWDKAGIIKGGVPVITAVEDEAAYKVIEDIATAHRAKVYRLGREFTIQEPVINNEGQSFTFNGPFQDYKNIELGLRGSHQFANAATSLMALELLRQYSAFIIDEEDLLTGYRQAKHPGRLEVLSTEPLIVCDGAHNPHGAKKVAESIPQLYQYEKLTLVTSIMQDKAIDELLQYFMPLVDRVVITKAHTPRAAEPTLIQEKIVNQNAQLPIYIVEEPIEAVQKAIEVSDPHDLILIAGSLYLIESLRNELSNRIELRAGVK